MRDARDEGRGRGRRASFLKIRKEGFFYDPGTAHKDGGGATCEAEGLSVD